MNIGQAALASGISAKMIRHYESMGLLYPDRSDSGYRVYDEHDLRWLRFIRRARLLGFSLFQIRGLLSLWADRSRASSDVKKIAGQHIADLNERINELIEMRDSLQSLTQSCRDDQSPNCAILQALAEN